MSRTTIRWIRAKFNSTCASCGDDFYEDDVIAYDFEERAAYCEDCGQDEEEHQQARQENNAYARSVRSKHDDIDDFEDC